MRTQRCTRRAPWELSVIAAASPTGRFDARSFCIVLMPAQRLSRGHIRGQFGARGARVSRSAPRCGAAACASRVLMVAILRACALPFTSRISPRTPGRSCGWPPAWACRRRDRAGRLRHDRPRPEAGGARLPGPGRDRAASDFAAFEATRQARGSPPRAADHARCAGLTPTSPSPRRHAAAGPRERRRAGRGSGGGRRQRAHPDPRRGCARSTLPSPRRWCWARRFGRLGAERGVGRNRRQPYCAEIHTTAQYASLLHPRATSAWAGRLLGSTDAQSSKRGTRQADSSCCCSFWR